MEDSLDFTLFIAWLGLLSLGAFIFHLTAV